MDGTQGLVRLRDMCCRSLQQSSGAHILVDQNYPEGADRMVIIKGPRENATRAAAMINELIAGEPGSASAIISKVGEWLEQCAMCVTHILQAELW